MRDPKKIQTFIVLVKQVITLLFLHITFEWEAYKLPSNIETNLLKLIYWSHIPVKRAKIRYIHVVDAKSIY